MNPGASYRDRGQKRQLKTRGRDLQANIQPEYKLVQRKCSEEGFAKNYRAASKYSPVRRDCQTHLATLHYL